MPAKPSPAAKKGGRKGDGAHASPKAADSPAGGDRFPSKRKGLTKVTSEVVTLGGVTFRVDAESMAARNDDEVYERHRNIWERLTRGQSRVYVVDGAAAAAAAVAAATPAAAAPAPAAPLSPSAATARSSAAAGGDDTTGVRFDSPSASDVPPVLRGVQPSPAAGAAAPPVARADSADDAAGPSSSSSAAGAPAPTGLLVHSMCGTRKFGYEEASCYGYRDHVERVIAMEKENGENAQVSAFTHDGVRYWLIGSKNVPMLVRHTHFAEDMGCPAYASGERAQRYVFARRIAQLLWDTLLSPDAAAATTAAATGMIESPTTGLTEADIKIAGEAVDAATAALGPLPAPLHVIVNGSGATASASDAAGALLPAAHPRVDGGVALHDALARLHLTMVCEAIFMDSQHLVDYSSTGNCLRAFALVRPGMPSTDGLTAVHPLHARLLFRAFGLHHARIIGIAPVPVKGIVAVTAAEAAADEAAVATAIDSGGSPGPMTYATLCRIVERLGNSEGSVMYGLGRVPIATSSAGGDGADAASASSASSAAPASSSEGVVFMYKWKSHEYVIGRRARQVILGPIPNKASILPSNLRRLTAHGTPSKLIEQRIPYYVAFAQWLQVQKVWREAMGAGAPTPGAAAAASTTTTTPGKGKAAKAAAGAAAPAADGGDGASATPAVGTGVMSRGGQWTIQSQWVTLQRRFAESPASKAVRATSEALGLTRPAGSSAAGAAADAFAVDEEAEAAAAAAAAAADALPAYAGGARKVVIMFQGLPLTGKSTLARQLFALLHASGHRPRWINQDEAGAGSSNPRQAYLHAIHCAMEDASVTHILLDKTNIYEQNVTDYHLLGIAPAITIRMRHPEDAPGRADKLKEECLRRFRARGDAHRTLTVSAAGDNIETILDGFLGAEGAMAIVGGGSSLSTTIASAAVPSAGGDGTAPAAAATAATHTQLYSEADDADPSLGVVISHNILSTPADALPRLWNALHANGLVNDSLHPIEAHADAVETAVVISKKYEDLLTGLAAPDAGAAAAAGAASAAAPATPSATVESVASPASPGGVPASPSAAAATGVVAPAAATPGKRTPAKGAAAPKAPKPIVTQYWAVALSEETRAALLGLLPRPTAAAAAIASADVDGITSALAGVSLASSAKAPAIDWEAADKLLALRAGRASAAANADAGKASPSAASAAAAVAPASPAATASADGGAAAVPASPSPAGSASLLRVLPIVHHTLVFCGNGATDPVAEVEFTPRVGESVPLRALAIVWNGAACAVLLSKTDSRNAYPHVTLACADKVRPAYSNVLLEQWDAASASAVEVGACTAGTIFAADNGIHCLTLAGGGFEFSGQITRFAK